MKAIKSQHHGNKNRTTTSRPHTNIAVMKCHKDFDISVFPVHKDPDEGIALGSVNYPLRDYCYQGEHESLVQENPLVATGDSNVCIGPY